MTATQAGSVGVKDAAVQTEDYVYYAYDDADDDDTHVAALEAELDQVHKTLAYLCIGSVRSVAATILEVAAGNISRDDDGDFITTGCTNFRGLALDDQVVQEAAKVLSVAPEEFISFADSIVMRPHKAMYFGDLEQLDQEVAVVTFQVTPELQKQAKWECAVILAYTEIKAALPDGFKKMEIEE